MCANIVCICTYAGESACVCTGVWKPEILRQALSLSPELTSWLDWLATELGKEVCGWGWSSCLCLLELVTGMYQHSRLLCRSCGSELWLSGVCSKHFTLHHLSSLCSWIFFLILKRFVTFLMLVPNSAAQFSIHCLCSLRQYIRVFVLTWICRDVWAGALALWILENYTTIQQS